MLEKPKLTTDVPMERPLVFCARRRIAIFLALIVAAASCCAQTEAAHPTPSSQSPRINGPAIYGARPHHPFLYRIPTIGARPLKFSASDLPPGLVLDPQTGIISGQTPDRGTYQVTLGAQNAEGKATRSFRIVVGDRLALTPPMGWSSWYMAYADISDGLIRAQADALISSGLSDHGYSYINIDDGWNNNSSSKDPRVNGAPREENGNLKPNANFPDMAGLTDYLHRKGLKAGIYISPGPRTCGGYEGSYGHERQDAQLFAAWGFDFLKYDLCSYGDLLKGSRDPNDLKKPYALMGNILKSLDRDMLFNLCEYGIGNVWTWGREVGGNYWRTSDDVGSGIDGSLWKSMSAYGFGEAGREKWAGPGGWNDPDNILLGQIIWHDKLSPTPLTRDEQTTWMTLWSMLSAPLILGNDLTKLDDFTLSLLTNDEVVAVNQDVLGKPAAPIVRDRDTEIWQKDLEDGSKAIAFFNRGEKSAVMSLEKSTLKLRGEWQVRDLWQRRDLQRFGNKLEQEVAPHAAKMLQIRSVTKNGISSDSID
jgi:alpha-galactosidase